MVVAKGQAVFVWHVVWLTICVVVDVGEEITKGSGRMRGSGGMSRPSRSRRCDCHPLIFPSTSTLRRSIAMNGFLPFDKEVEALRISSNNGHPNSYATNSFPSSSSNPYPDFPSPSPTNQYATNMDLGAPVHHQQSPMARQGSWPGLFSPNNPQMAHQMPAPPMAHQHQQQFNQQWNPQVPNQSYPNPMRGMPMHPNGSMPFMSPPVMQDAIHKQEEEVLVRTLVHATSHGITFKHALNSLHGVRARLTYSSPPRLTLYRATIIQPTCGKITISSTNTVSTTSLARIYAADLPLRPSRNQRSTPSKQSPSSKHQCPPFFQADRNKRASPGNRVRLLLRMALLLLADVTPLTASPSTRLPFIAAFLHPMRTLRFPNLLPAHLLPLR